jgi:hypothetical protein
MCTYMLHLNICNCLIWSSLLYNNLTYPLTWNLVGPDILLKAYTATNNILLAYMYYPTYFLALLSSKHLGLIYDSCTLFYSLNLFTFSYLKSFSTSSNLLCMGLVLWLNLKKSLSQYFWLILIMIYISVSIGKMNHDGIRQDASLGKCKMLTLILSSHGAPCS